MKKKVVLLFQCESLNACQSLAPLVETKTKKKTLLRLSLASFSPHHYSQQQRSPFLLFIARQKLSNALKSLKSKMSLQESTNRASERVPFPRSYLQLALARAPNSRVKNENVSTRGCLIRCISTVLLKCFHVSRSYCKCISQGVILEST